MEINKNKYKEMERIIIDKRSIDMLEEEIIISRGIQRYMYVRQFVYGHVLDIACGVGYGSYLLSKNPDVIEIKSVDRSEKAIMVGNENFKNDKIEFVLGEPECIDGKFDVLVCLETIEHLPKPEVLRNLVERCGIKEVIISFPNKKTTHYNSYHLWDISVEDVKRLFDKFVCYEERILDDSTVLNFIKADRLGVSERKYVSVR